MSGTTSDPRAELERLRAEVARLETELGETPTATAPATPAPTKTRGGWWRSVVVGVCLLLVGVLGPLSILAIWAHDQVADTDRYVETVAPLAEEPAVQDVVITRITTQIVDLLQVKAVTDDALDALAQRGFPERATTSLRALTPALVNGVESFVGNQVRRLVTSDAFAQAWVEANRKAHDQMVAVLTGETGEAVEVSGNAVQLNLAVLIDAVKTRLLDEGFSLASRIPSVTAQFTLFQSDDLATAQTGFRLLEASARALPIIALLLLAVAVFVARRRRRTLMIGALVIGGSMILLGAALNLFRIVYLDAVPTDQLPTDAAEVIFDQLVRFIRTNLRAVLVLSLIVAAVAWVSGPDPAPVAVRRGSTRALDAVRHQRDRAGLDTGAVGRFLYTYRTPVRAVVLGGGVVAYALTDHPTGAGTLVILLVVAVILLVVELLARAAPPEAPPEAPAGGTGSDARSDTGAGSAAA